MSAGRPVVFLIDVDNTLLDNDCIAADLRRHLEREVDDVEQRYPADHYVLVDDKLRVLTAVTQVWAGRVTTVFPRQGHDARDPKTLATYPPADISIERIGDLLEHDLPSLLAGRAGSQDWYVSETPAERRFLGERRFEAFGAELHEPGER